MHTGGLAAPAVASDGTFSTPVDAPVDRGGAGIVDGRRDLGPGRGRAPRRSSRPPRGRRGSTASAPSAYDGDVLVLARPELAGRRAHPLELRGHAHRRPPRRHRRAPSASSCSSRPTPEADESLARAAAAAAARPTTLPTPSPLAPAPPTPTRPSGTWASGTLNPRYTFDQFVIGASNRFAHAAALSVAESPGRSYNPLFIYGPAGLGKTHLLHAIGHHVRTVFRNKRVRYVSTESFMNEFVDAIRAKAMPGFKRRYRDLDVLLIDDIQFLERTQELQEEFFHTFNQLHSEGGQIVISSDRPPKSIASLEDRLRTRFEWGLITDVQPPEFETRLAILRKKAESEHLGGIPAEVLAFIATNISDNIRELEGALIRVAAYSSLNRAELSEEVAQQVLADLLPPTTPRVITPELILDETAKMFGWTVDDLCGKSRRRPLVTARQIGMYVIRELTDLQLPPDRRGVRRPRPHDGHVRRRQDQAADDRAPRHLRPGQRAHRPHPAREQWIMLWMTWGQSPTESGENLGRHRMTTARVGCGRRWRTAGTTT